MPIISYSKIGRDSVLPEYTSQYPREPEYMISHYILEAWIDIQNKHLKGVVSLYVYKNKFSVREISLDAVALNILDVRDDKGSLKYTYDGNSLVIHLRRPLTKTPKKVIIEYEVKDPEYGLYFIEGGDETLPMVWTQGETEWHRYWMPIYDYPNMKFTSEMIIHVKKGFKAFGNGILLDHWRDSEWEVWHYTFDKPHSSYLIALTAGDFEVIKDNVDDIILEYVVPRGMKEYVENTFRNTPDIIRFFSEWTGVKYPYKVYRQVVVRRFVVGGMENISMTLLTDRALLDEHARLDYESEGLVSHELAHQWFGDLVTCRDWSHIWLNESFATYMDALYHRHWKGMDEYLYRLYLNLQSYLSEYTNYYSRPIVFRLYKYPEELFDSHSYPKGSVILHMLINFVGEDVFRAAIKEYLSKHAFSNADTEDLRKVIEKYYGRPLEWFFEQFLYNAGHPVLKAKYTYDSKEKLLTISINQIQADDSPDVYKIPLEIEVVMPKGKKIKHKIWMEEKTKNIVLSIPEKPEFVYIDPLFKVFAVLQPEYTLEDKIRILRESKYVYWRILMARSLSKEASVKAVDALYNAVLKDLFYGVSIEAAKSMGEIKTDYAKEMLLKLLDVKLDPRVRRNVIDSLGNYKGDDIAEKLIKILDDKNEAYSVRAAAARVLGKIKYSKAVDILKKYLDEKSYDYVITKGVLEGLAEIGGDEAFNIILKYTSKEMQESVRTIAISLLGKFPEKKETYEKLKELIYDRETMIKRGIVTAARELMDPRVVPILQLLETREKMGWTWKTAKLTEKKIREAAEKGVEWKKLRDEMGKVEEEMRRISERIEKIELKG